MISVNDISKVLKKAICIFVIIAVLVGVSGVACHAEGTLLSDPTYELLFQEETHANGAIVQSVCVSEYYIYTIENTADDINQNDIVSAYYREDTDENGNPVQRYSLAKRDQSRQWEHGNGMTYNPKTNEIYVAAYTSVDHENRGCLLVMNPDTLEYVRSIKISDSYNILSVAYDEKGDQYYIKTNAEGSFSNLILNSDFQVISELGAESPSPGVNFQAFCKVGDYLLHSPLTLPLMSNNYISAYSISTQQTVDVEEMDFGLESYGYNSVEPEQIIRFDDSSFLIVVNGSYQDGTVTAHYFRVKFPNFIFVDSLFGDTLDNTVVTTDASQSTASESAEDTTAQTPEADNSEADNSVADGTETVDSDVTDETTEDKTVRVTKESIEDISNVSSEKEKSTDYTVVIVIIVIVAVVAVLLYLYSLKIKRERAERDERIRRNRKILENERLYEQIKDLEGRESDKASRLFEKFDDVDEV